jgi:hypothetical protein
MVSRAAEGENDMTVADQERAPSLRELGYESDRDAIESAIDIAKEFREGTWEEALRQRPHRIRPYEDEYAAEGARAARR